MEIKTPLQLRTEEENKILKNINKEILKCAKKGDLHYYWDITGISSLMVKIIIEKLESEGKFISSKGSNFKIIRW